MEKAEILAYLRQSFDLMDPVREPYAGRNRFEVLTSASWHISDHYGQSVTYAHLNEVVPTASR